MHADVKRAVLMLMPGLVCEKAETKSNAKIQEKMFTRTCCSRCVIQEACRGPVQLSPVAWSLLSPQSGVFSFRCSATGTGPLLQHFKTAHPRHCRHDNYNCSLSADLLVLAVYYLSCPACLLVSRLAHEHRVPRQPIWGLAEDPW